MYRTIKQISIVAIIMQLAACGATQEGEKVSAASGNKVDKADMASQCGVIQTAAECTGQCRWVQCPPNARCFIADHCEAIPEMSSCLFGSSFWDGIDQGSVKVVSEKSFNSPEGIDSLLEKQIMTAAEESTSNEYSDLQEVINHSEMNELVVMELSAPDGRTFRSITFYPGDNAYGAIFRTGETEFVATFADDDFTSCLENL
jgi:hypothetical protein